MGFKFNPTTGQLDISGAGSLTPTNEITSLVELVTTSSNYENLWNYIMPLKNSQKISVSVVGQKFDGTDFCFFERVGLFYNSSGTVESQRVWQVLSSFRTNESIDIRYQIIGDNFAVQVKSLDSNNFYWKGEVKQIFVEVL